MEKIKKNKKIIEKHLLDQLLTTTLKQGLSVCISILYAHCVHGCGL